MTERRFDDHDHVLVVGDDSDFKGQWGRVLKYEDIFEVYYVVLPDVSPIGHFAFREEELEPLEDIEEEVEEDEGDDDADEDDDEDDDIEVPALGMSSDDLTTYLEFMLGRTLGRVGTIGPREVFFGYQEFEGMTPHEVLLAVLKKIEESMAMHAQLHILVARIGTALHQVHPAQIPDEEAS